MLDGLEPLGVVGIGILPGPLRKPLGVSRARATRGLRRHDDRVPALRRWPSETLRALGARGAEIPSAGARSTRYDGVEQQVGSIAGNELRQGRQATSTANVNLWPRPVVAVRRPRRRSTSSSDRQRDALRGAARAALPATSGAEQQAERGGRGDPLPPRRQVRHGRRRATSRRCAARSSPSTTGSSATRADQGRDRARSAPCVGGAVTPRRARLLQRPTPEAAASAAATPIDGVYRVHTTPEELSAAGRPGESTRATRHSAWT